MTNVRTRAQGLLCLLLAAVIWGFAFVAQREGMRFVGPFTFNGIRFALGSLALVPWAVGLRSRTASWSSSSTPSRITMGVAAAGLVLFVAANLQQAGLVHTSAGKAGFITGLYVVIVPLLGLLRRQRVSSIAWVGCLVATGGLYLLSMEGPFRLSSGDGLVLASAFGWAVHVQLAGWLTRCLHPIRLALLQFLICSALSLIVATLREPLSLDAIRGAGWSLAYAGFLSVGLAYTLQLVGQRSVRPTQAGLVMSLEAVFAVLGGWLLLQEKLPPRHLVGCGLMLLGMMLAQLRLRSAGRLRPPVPVP